MNPPLAVPVLTTPAEPIAVLRAGLLAAGGPVGLACSFSIEDVVLLDLLAESGLSKEFAVEVFALDTGRLPEATYEVAQALSERYGVAIAWYFPDPIAVESLLRHKGPFSFRGSLADRHECCGVRKVAPLLRALHGKSGWITGQRREHGVTRTALLPIESDPGHGGILKLNPLCDWTEAQVWAHADARALPRSRLYAQGYASIGCAPCTRAVQPGEPSRAGRWWWESPEHKECGLHRSPT
jgi:phosphoadenosine phosphosulfate reductase